MSAELCEALDNLENNINAIKDENEDKSKIYKNIRQFIQAVFLITEIDTGIQGIFIGNKRLRAIDLMYRGLETIPVDNEEYKQAEEYYNKFIQLDNENEPREEKYRELIANLA